MQRVCGIADNIESPENKLTEWQVEISAERIEGVVKVLKRRFKFQARLSRQLVELSKSEREKDREGERERQWGGITIRFDIDNVANIFSDEHTMDLGPDSDEQFPDPPSSQLSRWKPLSLSEVQVCQLAKPRNIHIYM